MAEKRSKKPSEVAPETDQMRLENSTCRPGPPVSEKPTACPLARVDRRHASGWFKPHSVGERSLKTLGIAYLAVLTALLLSRNPLGLMAIESDLLLLGALMPFAHLLSFSLLSFFALSVRWPLRRPVVLSMLVIYAIATEGLQWFVSSRTPELADVAQNLLGIAIGAAVCWLGLRMRAQITQYANS